MDDIKFFPSTNCSLLPAKADPSLIVTTLASTTSAPRTTLSTYSWSSQDPVDCNFELDFCLWQNDPTTPLNWKRVNASQNNFFNTGRSNIISLIKTRNLFLKFITLF